MHKDDRELLKLAAKAAGYSVFDCGKRKDGSDCLMLGPRKAVMEDPEQTAWNPLADDGDALRLAVSLGLGVGQHLGAAYAGVAPCQDDYEDGRFPVRVAEMLNDDPYAATRRAVVRAAAEIGRSE